MIDYKRIVELGKMATKRPWHWATSNSHRRLSNEQQDGKVAYGTKHHRDGTDDIVISECDMLYSEAACNSADIMAQQLMDIGKLERDFDPNLSLRDYRERVLAILERRKG